MADRIARGQVNATPGGATRDLRDIIRANVVTRFNLMIGSMLVVILIVAPIQDALFGMVAITNTLIGIIQELRAKRALDRLALISAPRARVVRDGTIQTIAVDEVVLDDVVVIGPGDQIVVDGQVLAAQGLEVNEALVTGEADAIAKQPGDGVLSGSFVAVGSGRIHATAVGADSYAGRFTEEARQFVLVNSELRAGIDRILRAVTWVIVPTAILLLISELLQAHGVRAALAGAVAGTVAMIPEGLVLLTSVAFAVAVVRLGRENVLVQELPAVETLARVDVVCFDKTGTVTTGDVRVQDVDHLDTRPTPDTRANLDDGSSIEAALGALADADPEPNATLRAIGATFARPLGWVPSAVVPFSSARRWSGATFGEHGTWVMGAPEALRAATGSDEGLRRRAERLAATGQRVVLLARADAPLRGQDLPPRLDPQALVILAEDIRPDATATIGYFADQGVRTIVISGDHPRTVAAVARRVGIVGADEPVAGDELTDDPDHIAALIEGRNVFGRVAPDHKRALVRGLRRRGHVVAMTGDGVNDVLALKEADIGIAVGDATTATRSVAQLVLLDGRFETLPHIVAEGRRVIANIERVASLFLTKTVYAALLAIAVGVARLPFPFLPRHLSLVGALTIGIPAFFLALEPNQRRAEPGFVKRTMRFALPAGAAAAVATFASYWLAQTVEPVSLEQARTAATVTLFGMGVLVLRLLSRPLNLARRALIYSPVVVFLLTFVLPRTREFFALEVPPAVVLLAAVGVVASAGVIMETLVNVLQVGQRLVRDEDQFRTQVLAGASVLIDRGVRALRDQDPRRQD